MNLPILSLTPESFAPYGKVIEQPTRSHDAVGPGWTWWGETALLVGDERPFGIGYLELKPVELTFDWAERHMRTMELIIPVGGDCLVYVGPPDDLDQPDRLPELERFQIFRIRQGQGVLLERGVWHGAPLALDQPIKVMVLLHQDTGKGDGFIARFPQTPVKIDK